MPVLPRVAASAVLALALLSAAQAQTSAITLNTPGPVFESAPYTLGFAFSVSTDVRLVGLGVYDHGADGLEAVAEVGLWLGDQTDPLRSALVDGGKAAPLDGLFRFAPVDPLVLKPGQVYLIGAYLDGGWATSAGMGGTGSATVDPRVTLVGDRFADGFFSISHPGQSDGSAGAWLGANFQLAPVPEPAPAGLLALGLAALAWRRRSGGAA